MQKQTCKFEMVPFSVGHLHLMTLRDREKQMIDRLVRPEVLAAIEAGTIVEHGDDDFIRVLGVVGVRLMWSGSADVFLVPCANLSKRNTIAFVRQVKKGLQVARDAYGIRRFQTVAVDDELHNRWLTFLGFEREGHMKEYSANGEDYNLWALRQQY